MHGCSRKVALMYHYCQPALTYGKICCFCKDYNRPALIYGKICCFRKDCNQLIGPHFSMEKVVRFCKDCKNLSPEVLILFTKILGDKIELSSDLSRLSGFCPFPWNVQTVCTSWRNYFCHRIYGCTMWNSVCMEFSFWQLGMLSPKTSCEPSYKTYAGAQ